MTLRIAAPYEEIELIYGIRPNLIASVETFLAGEQYAVHVYLDCTSATPVVKLPAESLERAEQIVEQIGRALGDDRVDLHPRSTIVRRSKIASLKVEYDVPRLGKRAETFHRVEVYLDLQASTPKLTPGYTDRNEVSTLLHMYTRDNVTTFSYTS